MNRQHKRLTQVLVAILGLGVLTLAPTVRAALPAAASGMTVPSLAPMLKPILPAVVNITTQGRIAEPTDPFSQPADERGTPSKAGKRFESIGSGVIVDAKNGYILTNAHLTDQTQVIIAHGDFFNHQPDIASVLWIGIWRVGHRLFNIICQSIKVNLFKALLLGDDLGSTECHFVDHDNIVEHRSRIDLQSDHIDL